MGDHVHPGQLGHLLAQAVDHRQIAAGLIEVGADGGDAPQDGGAGLALQLLAEGHRQAQVGVGVDDPRQHIQAGGVDDPVGPHLGAAWEEAFHPFPGNEDVQRAHGSGINDDAVCDQSRTHGVSPVKHPLPCPAA